MQQKALTQKNTLLKNAQANAKGIFFKRVFFLPPKENFFPSLPFLINLFSPTHGLTANLIRHSYECKSLRTTFCANIGGHIFVAKAWQHITAPTQKAGFRASQTVLCKPKVQFSE